jgi:hypothetical protein
LAEAFLAFPMDLVVCGVCEKEKKKEKEKERQEMPVLLRFFYVPSLNK